MLDPRGLAGIERRRGRTDDRASLPARLLGLRTGVYASGGGTDWCRPSAAPSSAKAGRSRKDTTSEKVPPGVGCDAFVFIATTNTCPCGSFGDPRRACSCAAGAIGRYQKRIIGPLLDRIDIHLDVPRIPHEQLSDRRPGELSATIQERVERARACQTKRFAGTALLTNANMDPEELRQRRPGGD